MKKTLFLLTLLLVSCSNETTEVAETPKENPLYFTTMTHMEENFKDDEDEDLFNRHVEQIRYAVDLFDEYGAKLTIESARPFILANRKWNLNIMKEISDSGHGVGTHCGGIVPTEDDVPVNIYAQKLEAMKAMVDDIVGAENNLGCSGGMGASDWVTAASRAGFKFLNGVTAFAYLSVDEDKRPEGFSNQAIKNIYYHDPIPLDFEERLYPFELKDSSDLEADKDGILTIMAGDLNEIQSQSEGRNNCKPKCVFTVEDIDVIFESIDKALEIRDPNRFAHLNIHIPLSTFEEENEETFKYFLEKMAEYEEKGLIKWATQLEAYEAYKSF